jgi:hypothetical protein
MRKFGDIFCVVFSILLLILWALSKQKQRITDEPNNTVATAKQINNGR